MAITKRTRSSTHGRRSGTEQSRSSVPRLQRWQVEQRGRRDPVRVRHVPDSLLSTVGHFYGLGLPESVMVDAARTAGTARGIYDRPAYFAGMCWKRVRAMQDIAEQIVSQEGER